MTDRIKYLETIRNATEEILAEAQEHKHEIEGPINWADLHCIESRYVMTDGGDEFFEVLIEEAYPANPVLHVFIRNRLIERDFDLVYPIFEW